MNIVDIILKFTGVDYSYDTSKYTNYFNNVVKTLKDKAPKLLFNGTIYRVHQNLTYSNKQFNARENPIKDTNGNYTHWSKREDIYNHIFSDAHPKCSVFTPFILIEADCKNGLDRNKIFEDVLEKCPRDRYYNEEEIIYPLNVKDIKKVWYIKNEEVRKDKSKWEDITNKVILKEV